MSKELVKELRTAVGCSPSHIEHLLTEAASLIESLTTWRDIESAPRDGTYVIVMHMHIDTQIVHNAFYACESDGWDKEDVGWWSYEHSEVSRIKLDDWLTPTHWMPLPLTENKDDTSN